MAIGLISGAPIGRRVGKHSDGASGQAYCRSSRQQQLDDRATRAFGRATPRQTGEPADRMDTISAGG